jgi:hypothetical protein
MRMKSRVYIALAIALIALGIFPAKAAFTSFYVFGDGISCTATNPQAGKYYYGKRFSNGRVWVEVLAQQQGLAFDPNGNVNSYFGNTSANLVNEVNKFNAPADASNALVVIWVNNADLYYPAFNDTPTLAGFMPTINQAQANHYKAITNLYAKGVRTLIMPNAVDISTVPQFNTSQYTNVFHQASVNYNTAFYNTLTQAQTDCPGLTIIIPDFYTLLNNLLAYPASYGVTNMLYDYGYGSGPQSIDAISYFVSINGQSLPLNGPGNNFIFWDQKNPTAMVHYIMANMAQQLISPVQIAKIAPVGASNRLDVVNMPVGMNGFVDGTTNLSSGWAPVTNFLATATSQSLFVPAPVFSLPSYPPSTNTGPVSIDPSNTNNITAGTSGVSLISAAQFYQLRFPANWTWP